ncbi:KpsF/GutQ family sugar-phosphate isomerase [endosymbiont of unidentified scaly snail isolate Monju]|uniref:KpsF/GutQ family sugar-phosphate isomerase n=1 Tax=endosymbiont of unidentified scaly snail isolate Monju TaxID=1248727 RepID=UPI0003892B09|nr:KpsF/GutQ family sugar-phosphate isomerase [endosymbiont of unidentified scaly snail isolate Monju]BAN70073.1 arabinose-5-phosphate isomerase [endosymbiont of unidentified scaly snail isolate Monju]
MVNDSERMIELGREVVDIERNAVAALHERIGEAFAHACVLMMNCEGRVVVTGMGKSGHIGSKIAATLASTGTPAFFVHPGEASHGDLGMITPGDVVLALSNSGETGEVLTILPLLKRMGVPLIALTGNAGSTLAREAEVHLDVGVEKEACPLDLAPTASTTAALVMGDALAIALLQARGFTHEDFALSHPGGSLGKRLLLRVSDLMHEGERLPVVRESDPLREALLEMTAKGLGMTAILDASDTLIGVFTDGDLRRCFDARHDLHDARVGDVMTRGGVRIQADRLAAEALKLMQDRQINALLVVDSEDRLVGALNMHDLLRAGVV